LVGIGIRLWMISGRIGVLDSDGGVPGLMALHAPRELPVFYWGQAYGGSIESFVATVLFGVLPASSFVLRLIPITFCAGSAILCWRIASRLLDEPTARVAGALCWLPSLGLVWWSTKVGPYWAGLFFTMLALLLLMRAAEEETWPPPEVAALGFVGGVAWWANPQAIYLLLPAAIMLAPKLLPKWRNLPLLVMGFVVGAEPWLVYNLRHGWASFEIPPQGTTLPNGYLDHLHGFFTTALPMALGLRPLFSNDWLHPVLGPVLYAAFLIGFVVVAVQAVRTRSRLVFAVVLALAYPFLYALSPFSWYVGSPRYLAFLTPVLAILVASLTGGRLRPTMVALGAACLVLAFGIASVVHTGTSPGAPDVAVPVKLGGLEDLLRDNGVRHAFANYWIAYRVTFELRERVVVTPPTGSRYPPFDKVVRRDPRPGYLFVAGTSWERRFLEELAKRSVKAEIHQRGRWVLVLPERKVLPEEVGDAWKG
jgi:hypothetical protein